MDETVLCPRCEAKHYTPYGTEEATEEAPRPAFSRVANIYICSWCGMHEAVLDMVKEPPIPPDKWPVILKGE